MSIPDRIANAPELEDGLAFYWFAFWQLSPDRPSGFGPAPIPGWAIRRFAFDYELTEDERDELVFLIRKMDDVFLEIMVARQKAAAKK